MEASLSEKAKDNIFLRSGNDDSGLQLSASDEAVPSDEDLLPRFIGIYPSSSPTQIPTDLLEDTSLDPLVYAFSQKKQYKYFTAEELSTAFGSYCPSLSSDETKHVGSSPMFKKSDSSRSSFQRSNENISFIKENDSNKMGRSLTYDVEAALLWAALSLGLGIWLYALSTITKGQTEEEGNYRKATPKRKPKASHLSTRISSSSFQKEAEKQLRNNDETNTRTIEEQIEEYLYEERSPTSTSLKELLPEQASNNEGNDLNDAISREGKPTVAKPLVENETQNDDALKSNETRLPINTDEENDIERCDKKQNNTEEEPFLMPILPVVSDLSIPPGLSSSSSISSRQSDDGEVIPDEASTGVLTTDDIYTGGAATLQTSGIYYLSYGKEQYNISKQICELRWEKAGQKTETTNYLTRCDDSKSTINLLTDNEGSQRSNRLIVGNKRNADNTSIPPSLPFTMKEEVHDFLDYHPSVNVVRNESPGNQLPATRNHPMEQYECSVQKNKFPQKSIAKGNADAGESITCETGTTTSKFVSHEFEAIPLRSYDYDRQGEPQVLCFLGLKGQRMIVALSCALIVVSIILCTTLGISRLYGFQSTINFEFESLANEITSKFASFDSTELYLLLSELDSQKEQVYFILDGHCPEISTKLCDYSFRSSSCNLEGVPLEDSWKELLVASDRISQVNPNDPLLNWFINAREYSLHLFPLLRKSVRNALEKWSTYLAIEATLCIATMVLVLAILVRVLYKLTEKRWQSTHQQSGPPSQDFFYFCSGRIFAVIFWFLFLSAWIWGLVFSITRGAIVRVCDSDQPSFVVADHFGQWQENAITLDSDISDFLNQQFHYCLGIPLRNENSVLVPNALSNRIETLARIIDPIEAITDELRDLSLSGSFEETCGSDAMIISRAIDDMGAQLCNDANFVTDVYLNIMSCEHSSWVPLYESMLDDTICTTGLQGITWIVSMQVATLFFGIILWVFRPIFLDFPCKDL